MSQQVVGFGRCGTRDAGDNFWPTAGGCRRIARVARGPTRRLTTRPCLSWLRVFLSS